MIRDEVTRFKLEKPKNDDAAFVRKVWEETALSTSVFEDLDDLDDPQEIIDAVRGFIANSGATEGMKCVYQRFLLHYAQGSAFRDYLAMLMNCGVVSDEEKCGHLSQLFSRVLRGQLVLQHVLPANAFGDMSGNQWSRILMRMEQAEAACQ
ncbi:MAG: hypothetical protein MJ249_10285 [Kiritimatiellae bacterium]|nr:hypothetical protein [Kiritimatiellia bacterium]